MQINIPTYFIKDVHYYQQSKKTKKNDEISLVDFKIGKD